MKILNYPKKLKFPEGISSGAIYSTGLSDKQIEKLQKTVKESSLQVNTIIVDNPKSFDYEWSTSHCGQSDAAIMVFTETTDALNLILMAMDYYTKFPPTTFIILDESLSETKKKLVEWYAEKCKLKLYTQKDFDKICKILTFHFRFV